VTPASATTDAAGISGFQWSPDGGAASQLKLSVEAAPTVAVTFNAGSGVPVISAIVNAASFAAGVAPGSLATLFGVNLSGASVLLNGVDVRPFYARDTQVNFYIPAETPTGANVVTVTAPSGLQVSAAVDVVGVQPGIFSGAVLHSGTSVNAITSAQGSSSRSTVRGWEQRAPMAAPRRFRLSISAPRHCRPLIAGCRDLQDSIR
jgi:hypothetical protein